MKTTEPDGNNTNNLNTPDSTGTLPQDDAPITLHERPILYSEYHRRVAFEKLALVYLKKKLGLVLVDHSKIVTLENGQEVTEAQEGGDEDSSGFLNMMYLYYLLYLSYLSYLSYYYTS
jgi:hypothetical protein